MTSIGRPLKSNRSTPTISSLTGNSRDCWKNTKGSNTSIVSTSNHLTDTDNRPAAPMLGVGICRSTAMSSVNEVENVTPRKPFIRSNSQDNIIRDAMYIGSFSVDEETQEARAIFIRKELQDIKYISQGKEVKLIINLSGIKVCSVSDSEIIMAHALKRISYATCNPERCQISILAREPKSSSNIQYCHTFNTRMPSEAEDINKVIANSFKMAYNGQKVPDDGQTAFLGSRQFLSTSNFTSIKNLPDESQRECESKLRRETIFANESQRECESKLRRETIFANESQRECQFRRESSLVDESQPERECKYKRETSFNELIESQMREKQLETDMALSRKKENLNEQLIQISTPNVFALAQERRERKSREDKSISDDNLTWAQNIVEEAEGYLTNADVANDDAGVAMPIVSLVTILRHLATSGLHGNQASPVSIIKSLIDTHFIDIPLVPVRRTFEKYKEQKSPTLVEDENCTKEINSNRLKSEEDTDLFSASWYQPGVPREIALEALRHQEMGSFVIRNSSTHPGCFALSILTPKPDLASNITHYLITKTNKGLFKIKGLTKEWSSLSSLVRHHSQIKELLPCLLILPQNTNNESIVCR